MMKRLHAFALPSLLILSALACTTKPDLDSPALLAMEPVVLRTSLADTLPAKTLAALSLDAVEGVKLKYLHDGRDIRYFEYRADRQALINAISRSPFSKHAALADTVCRKVTHEYLKRSAGAITDTETQAAAFFWNIDPDEYDAFECLKSPVKHTILISRRSGKILHRVEITA